MPMPCLAFILSSKSLHPINVSKYRSVKYSALCKVQFSSTVYVQFTIVKYRTVVYNIQYSKYYYFILYVLWGLYLSFSLLLFHFNFLFAFQLNSGDWKDFTFIFYFILQIFRTLQFNQKKKFNFWNESKSRVIWEGKFTFVDF